MVQSHSRTRPAGHRQEDRPGQPLHCVMAGEEASQAVEKGHHYATPLLSQAFLIHIHPTIPGGQQTEIANATLIVIDETGDLPRLDALQ